MVAAMKDSTCSAQLQKKTSSKKKALKYSWLSIQIRDPMMKGRSGISRAWNLQETPWTQKIKEKHEEEHKDSKKENKNQNNQSLYQESQDYQPDMNSLKEIKQKN
jgi:hypothetical protein